MDNNYLPLNIIYLTYIIGFTTTFFYEGNKMSVGRRKRFYALYIFLTNSLRRL